MQTWGSEGDLGPFLALGRGLAARIREAVGSAPMRARAAALGATMRAEDGVARAVAIVERAAEGRR